VDYTSIARELSALGKAKQITPPYWTCESKLGALFHVEHSFSGISGDSHPNGGVKGKIAEN
jgi:hypothetical protein